jgi:hypothetical protein
MPAKVAVKIAAPSGSRAGIRQSQTHVSDYARQRRQLGTALQFHCTAVSMPVRPAALRSGQPGAARTGGGGWSRRGPVEDVEGRDLVPSGSQIAARAPILQLMTALLPDIRREQITLAPLAQLVGSTELPPCPGAMCLHSAADVVPLGGRLRSRESLRKQERLRKRRSNARAMGLSPDGRTGLPMMPRENHMSLKGGMTKMTSKQSF